MPKEETGGARDKNRE